MSQQRKLIIFGASGLIGSAVIEASKRETLSFPWKNVSQANPTSLFEFLKKADDFEGGADFLFANGLLNPGSSMDDLKFSNIEFPKLVMEKTAANPAHRYMTLGSIHESNPGLGQENPYLRSKILLSQLMLAQTEKPSYKGRCLHLRLHTVYGKKLKSHMFLGQIADALKKNERFAMSSGDQLREYQYCGDIADSILDLFSREWDFGTIVDLTYGDFFTLRELAARIFEHFNKLELLQVGELRRSSHEVFEKYPRSPTFLRRPGTDSLSRIIEVLNFLVH